MPNSDLKVLGEKVRTERKLAGLTQEQLAERCHVSTKHIANIEKGSMNPCKFQCQSSLAHRTAGRFEQCHQGLISHHRRLQRGTSAFRQPPQNNVLLLL